MLQFRIICCPIKIVSSNLANSVIAFVNASLYGVNSGLLIINLINGESCDLHTLSYEFFLILPNSH